MLCAQLRAEAGENLDQTLLDDLEAELLDTTEESQPAEFETELLEEIGEDFGIASSAKDGPLARVVKHMQTAKSRLQKISQTDSASAAQGEALVGLETMITEITRRKSQCQGGNCKKPATPKPDKKKSGENKKPNGKSGKDPAQSADSTTNSDANLATDLAATGQLVKDLWGKLPLRQRQQILQPLSEEFLPKYADEIEAYFRALAQPKQQVPVETQ